MTGSDPVPRALRRPRPLRPGDPVAVVAPASPPRDPERYADGLAHLRAVYDVRTAYTPDASRGYLAASDAARAAALNGAIADPEIRGMVCVRGGYGSMRLLNRIDWDAARQHPTLLVGYSDVTALQLALYQHAGWTSLSGPVVTEWPVPEAAATLDAVQDVAAGDCPDLSTLGAETLRALVPGTATGRLLGGTLAVLTRLVGTPHLPSLDGAILVLEEVGEAPYRVDRMLTHLDLAGHLDGLAGVVLGRFTTGDTVRAPTLSLDEVFADVFAHRPYPVATNLAYGHCLPRHVVPWGVRARLSVTEDAASLRVLEPAVDQDASDGPQ